MVKYAKLHYIQPVQEWYKKKSMTAATFEHYIDDLHSQIAASKDRIAHAPKPAAWNAYAWQQTIDAALEPILHIPHASAECIHPPKNAPLSWLPDYALPMFRFAKELKTNPVALAEQVVAALQDIPELHKVEAAGPYVNILLADAQIMQSVQAILAAKDRYGHNGLYDGQVAIVEYSSPNVAKPFGINHLRSTVIGEAIARLCAASGYAVVRDNHLGDWGTQFGNLLAAHATYAPDTDFASLSMDEMTALYVRFSQEKKTSAELTRLGQTYFARLEAGDATLRAMWLVALQKSLDEFLTMYDRLGVRFDTLLGEAFFVERSNKLIESMAGKVSSDVLVYDSNSKAVYIEGEHPVVIRTQDGYGVYAARDLATIEFRQKEYAPDICIYVVGDEQSSYFRTIFSVAHHAGLTDRGKEADMQLEHINFGLLLDADGKKLSTRKGTSGKLEDVLNLLDEQAVKETRSRNSEMPEDQVARIAHTIAVGALIWNDLRTDRTSSVRFDIQRMLELGGGSVVDVLYSYSRTCSILQKLGIDDAYNRQAALPSEFSSPTEHQLAVLLSELPAVVAKATEARAPHILVGYIQELVQLHGRFYEESRVIGVEDKSVVELRIALHQAYKTTIANGLQLLNIPLSERL